MEDSAHLARCLEKRLAALNLLATLLVDSIAVLCNYHLQALRQLFAQAARRDGIERLLRGIQQLEFERGTARPSSLHDLDRIGLKITR